MVGRHGETVETINGRNRERKECRQESGRKLRSGGELKENENEEGSAEGARSWREWRAILFLLGLPTFPPPRFPFPLYLGDGFIGFRVCAASPYLLAFSSSSCHAAMNLSPPTSYQGLPPSRFAASVHIRVLIRKADDPQWS